jgi:hypothetical protein
MLVSWSLRFVNSKVEAMIGRAMSYAMKRRRRMEKDEMKRLRREWRRERRREEKGAREGEGRSDVAADGKGRAKTATTNGVDHDGNRDDVSDGEDSYCGMTPPNISHSHRAVDEMSSNLNELD